MTSSLNEAFVSLTEAAASSITHEVFVFAVADDPLDNPYVPNPCGYPPFDLP